MALSLDTLEKISFLMAKQKVQARLKN